MRCAATRSRCCCAASLPRSPSSSSSSCSSSSAPSRSTRSIQATKGSAPPMRACARAPSSCWHAAMSATHASSCGEPPPPAADAAAAAPPSCTAPSPGPPSRALSARPSSSSRSPVAAPVEPEHRDAEGAPRALPRTLPPPPPLGPWSRVARRRTTSWSASCGPREGGGVGVVGLPAGAGRGLGGGAAGVGAGAAGRMRALSQGWMPPLDAATVRHASAAMGMPPQTRSSGRCGTAAAAAADASAPGRRSCASAPCWRPCVARGSFMGRGRSR